MTHLIVKDLDASRELDTEAMQMVSGGISNLEAFSAQSLIAETQAGLVGITTATQTLIGVNTQLDLDISPVTTINLF